MEITPYNHHAKTPFFPASLILKPKNTGSNRAFALIQSVLAFFARACPERSRRGGKRCCRYYLVCHAARLASEIWRSSPALYHVLVLPPIALSAYRAQPRPLLRDKVIPYGETSAAHKG